jgi:peptidoglycan/LPS O-acetylase OafA/YrhL
MQTVAEPVTIQNSGARTSAVLESHLPSLDGMRAVSILLVLGFHANLARFGETGSGQYYGRLGVFVFFVISGLLITWLMLRERDATGAFSLRNFYIRRFLRILPVFWLFLLTVSILKSAHVISIQWLDIFRAFTFTYNYVHIHSAWWVGHCWSLSLEEQFYLVWPSLFALLPRKVSPRLAVILALSAPILRIVTYFVFPSLRGLNPDGFEARIDILMAGCASAFLLDSPAWRDRIRKIPVWPTLAVTSTFLLIVEPILELHFVPHSTPSVTINLFVPTLQAVVIALTLLVVVGGKPGVPFRLLNSRIPTHFGKLSYSVYIWQQLFLVPGSAPSTLSLLCRLAIVYLVAFCSFNFFERPFLKLRSKFRHGVSV